METETRELDAAFGALSDPTRRRILRRLVEGEAKVSDVAAPLDMALPSVSKHIKVLEAANLIVRDVRGREHWLHLNPAGFRAVVDHLGAYEQFWELSLRRLERLVEEPDGGSS